MTSEENQENHEFVEIWTREIKVFYSMWSALYSASLEGIN